MRRAIAAFVLAVLAACGEADGERVSASASPVIGGTSDATHDAVVSIVTTPDAASPELCSGTVIAPRVVLTAGHCTWGQDASALVVGIGPSARAAARTVAVASVVTYPGFGGGFDDVQAGLDLGALVLAEDAGVAPVALARGDAGALVGASVTLVGFGQSVALDIDTRGDRRAAPVAVGGACSALLSFGDATANACHGDSGGPLLDASGSVAAVVSYGDEVHCATPSFAVRVDRYLAWIDAVVAGADAAACTGCPPRATDCGPADAGADAARDADAPTSPAPPTVAGGGCATSPAGRSASPMLALVLALSLALRRRPARR